MQLIKFRKYCALRRVKYFLVLKDFFIDFYANLFYKPSRKNIVTSNKPKILFFNSGHLGDALIMSYCLPKIKEKYPDVEIDIVCGDWCKFIFAENHLVRKVIIQNHFMTNRKAISEFEKLKMHFKTAVSAKNELKKEVYDYSFDVRYSAAVSHWLLPFIKVKKAFGFGTRGYGGLLEKELFLPDYEFHAYEMIANLLQEINIETNQLTVQPYLPFKAVEKTKIQEKLPISTKMLLVFPESGAEIKMFENDFWIKLCDKILQNSDFDLMLCGEKSFTQNLFEALKNALPNYQNRINFAGKLTLSELAMLPQIASASVTLDSFPAHLCSIFSKTAIISKNAGGFQFFPINNAATLMLHNHENSKDLKFERNNFASQYVSEFAANEIDSVVSFLIKH